jgi:hypothetical protein
MDDDDDIVREIREHRAAHAARFNYDLHAIFADLRRREAESGRAFVAPAAAANDAMPKAG